MDLAVVAVADPLVVLHQIPPLELLGALGTLEGQRGQEEVELQVVPLDVVFPLEHLGADGTGVVLESYVLQFFPYLLL